MLTDVTLQPANGGKAQRAVIILHGLGDSAEGIIGLAEPMRPALPDTVFVAPNAPFPCDFSPFGYQWFSANDWTSSVVLEGVKRAATPLNEYIDHVMATYDLTPDKVALVGFSQGTMMSLYVAPRRKPQLACVVGYSGALIGGENLPAERQSAPPVLLVHGTHDDVVPYTSMLHAAGGLQNANIDVQQYTSQGLGHSIDDGGLTQGVLFLRKALGV